VSQCELKKFFIRESNYGAKTEGAGSQYQRKLLTYLYSKNEDLKFVNIDEILYLQGYDTECSESMIRALWNNAFSFLSKEKVDSNLYKNIKILNFNFLLDYFTKLNISERDFLLKIAGDEFRKSVSESNLNTKYDLNKYNIAVHFRAKQSTDKPPFKYYTYPWQYFNIDYDLPDNNPIYYAKLYANVINQISKMTEVQVVLHLHTMASDDDLKYFLSLIESNIEIKIKRKILSINALIEFVYADVFIGSHSSFSWLAILLRDKQSYIRKNFRHFLPSNTKTIDEVYYVDGELIKNIYRFFQKILRYSFFYPIYFFKLLKCRVYF
jgi:hypothetical protein